MAFIRFYIYILSGKKMDIDAYGQYSLILSYVTITSFYSLLSLNQTDVKDLVSKKSSFINLSVGKLSISLVVFLFVWIVTYLYSSVIFVDVGLLILLLLLLSYFFHGACYAEILTQSNLDIEVYLSVKVAITIILLLFKLYVVNEQITILDASILFLLDYFLFFLWSCIFLIIKRHSFCGNRIDNIGWLWWSKCVSEYLTRLKENYHLVLSAIIITTYSKIDQYMLGILSGKMSDVAYLSVISKFQDGLIVIVTVFGMSSFPGLINSKMNDNYGFLAREFIWKSFKILVFISVLYFLMLPYVIKFVFDSELDNGIALIYSISILFCGLNVTTGRLLIIDGLPNIALYRNILALSVNLLANYLLIPLFSIKGAALASLISWFISGFLFLVICKQTRYYFLGCKLNEKI
ncbi:membrane protein [Vibrio mimicus CAIM 602]|nr:membrane protein [Vibrio mimicus CAIM 602]